jgi:hypothetical protein
MNEVYRENLFQTWSFTPANVPVIFGLIVAFPLLVHHLIKDEFAIRDASAGEAVTPRF